MAKIKGIEEMQRVVKTIEEKISSIEEINNFFFAMNEGIGSVKLSYQSKADNKRHTIPLNMQPAVIYEILDTEKKSLNNEIRVLCQTHNIELSEEELQILNQEFVVEESDVQADEPSGSMMDASAEYEQTEEAERY